MHEIQPELQIVLYALAELTALSDLLNSIRVFVRALADMSAAERGDEAGSFGSLYRLIYPASYRAWQPFTFFGWCRYKQHGLAAG